MAASTMAPMAIAMPPRDMMLAVIPIMRIGMNEIITATGMVIIGIAALGIGRAGDGARYWQRDAGPRPAARRFGFGRLGRSGLRHHRDAAGRERSARDRSRESQDQGDRAGIAAGCKTRNRLRPLGADPGIHR